MIDYKEIIRLPYHLDDVTDCFKKIFKYGKIKKDVEYYGKTLLTDGFYIKQ